MLTRSARPSLAGPAPCSPRVRPVPPPSPAARTGSSSHAGGFRLLGPSGSFSGAHPGVSRPHPVDDIYWAGHAVSRARFLSRSNPTHFFHQPPPCSACGKLPPGGRLPHLPPPPILAPSKAGALLGLESKPPGKAVLCQLLPLRPGQID